MKIFIAYILIHLMHLWSHLYTYHLSLWLVGKRNMLYTLWISNFLGSLDGNLEKVIIRKTFRRK